MLTMRDGDSVVTNERTIGDKKSSPMLSNSVQYTGRNGPLPKLIKRKLAPRMKRPMSILDTRLGSVLIIACRL